jgi:predicted hexulose-6-phosphate isomerase
LEKGYCLGIYEKALPHALDFRQKLAAAKKCGFDFLEISIDETDEKLARLDWTAAQILELKRACVETGLPIRTMCLSGNRKYPIGSADKPTERRGLEIVGKAIGFAAQLGIRIVQLAGYDVYYEPSTQATRARFADNLKVCAHMAARAGVMLAFETMEVEFMNTVEKAMHFVRLIGSPYLQVYPDTGNISNGTDDIERDILTGRGHIAAAHLKETKPGVYREVPYGAGHVDFDLAMRTFRRLGVNMFLAEFWHDGGDDWMDKARAAHDFLSEKLDKTEG